jgi:hypothetical protein
MTKVRTNTSSFNQVAPLDLGEMAGQVKESEALEVNHGLEDLKGCLRQKDNSVVSRVSEGIEADTSDVMFT